MTNCIHSKVRRYKIKGTNKIRWICEKCGATGIQHILPKKVQPEAYVPQIKPIKQQSVQQYPSIQGQGIGYRNITENLQSGMNDFNQGMKNIPHLIIGKNKEQNKDQKPIFNDKEQFLVDKLKKWALIVAIILVVGYAGYRVLGVVFGW